MNLIEAKICFCQQENIEGTQRDGDAVEFGYNAGFRAGAEAAREAAAKHIAGNFISNYRILRAALAGEIRAMPLPEPKP